MDDMKLISALKKLIFAETKTKKADKKNNSFKENREKYIASFEKFKEYLGEPSDQYKKWAAKFKKNKEPHTERDDDDKEYSREHYLDWEDNFNSIDDDVFFDRSQHNDYLEEYQKLKAEQANESDNPGWWVESSDVLTMFRDVKQLAETLMRLDFKKEDLSMVIHLMDSLRKLMFGNGEVEGWFYTPEGVTDFLYFLNYSFKNYY